MTQGVFHGHHDDVVVTLGRDEFDPTFEMRERPVDEWRSIGGR